MAAIAGKEGDISISLVRARKSNVCSSPFRLVRTTDKVKVVSKHVITATHSSAIDSSDSDSPFRTNNLNTFIDRKQSDLRRFQLNSCEILNVEQT